MSPRQSSPSRETGPRHCKRGFISISPRSKSFQSRNHDDSISAASARTESNCRPLDDAEEIIIQKLEAKRQELDAKIVQYITDRQKEYDTLEQELYAGGSKKNFQSHMTHSSSSPNRAGNALESRGRSPPKDTMAMPVSRNIWLPEKLRDIRQPEQSSGDQTPVREQEKEFHDLFTPFFLPLLDAGSVQRSNSAPPVPKTTSDESIEAIEGYHSDHSARQQVRRAATEPFVKPAFSKKSALRSPKKSLDRKKRVSLIIDDEIVHPSESPKETNQLPPTPTEDELIDLPAITLTDRDGIPLQVWVPEKARLPYPDEDPLDYVIAVGGTMHHAIDLDEHTIHMDLDNTSSSGPIEEMGKYDQDVGVPLQRHPSDSLHSSNLATNNLGWPSSSPNEDMFGMSPQTDREPRSSESEHQPNMEIRQAEADPNSASLTKLPGPSPPTEDAKLPTSIIPSAELLSPTSPVMPPPSSYAPTRHAASYIDKFSTSSNRVFGNLVNESGRQREEAKLAYIDDSGPSSSYVGGLSGSGVDNVDVGSAGYPSSLGASYMEQFAASRAMVQRAKQLEEKEENERRNKARTSAIASEKGVRWHEHQEGQAGATEEEFLGEMEEL